MTLLDVLCVFLIKNYLQTKVYGEVFFDKAEILCYNIFNRNVPKNTEVFRMSANTADVKNDIMMQTINVIRSKRRTIAVEIKPDLQITVRAPIRMKDKDIGRFIEEKTAWIEKHIEKVKSRQARQLPSFTDAEIKELADDAAEDIPVRVKRYASLIGVTVNKVTIKNQKTLWGSCSSKGNLNFNCLLMLCPEDVRDYIVVHELCHRKEMNHSPRFWALVEQVLPDYKERRKWLKENGNSIIGRLR